MSKITSKNLHYDDTLPPFLARLHANNDAGDGRHEYTVARPKKTRTAEDEAEDEPVYFDEGSGETLTKSEWEAREAGEDVERYVEGSIEAGKKGGLGKADIGKEKIAGIGGGKKRKAGKVVGAEDEDDEDGDGYAPEKFYAEKKDATAKTPSTSTKKTEKAKPGKKAKKIKLSFGDDD
ncbi:uncharacterized protein L3040_002486 [Drepanopeziza brunnea f. sp. 'multigermtubi']|uniref:uncharacterized protein n=1 Tax=Drepanopeziza brunnea f. sp. 'multigermtubi' TaxID=698441 RepID=UPI0023A1C662|nr:hypothetical protein L3040_002486 [Drepanopeziza brunnea f. sp. 'multigermtubi']